MTPTTNSSNSINPNEYLNIPKWINEDYFLPIIEKDEPEFAAIKKFTPIAATAPGENYTSIMVRVVIDIQLKDGSEQQISYILKTMLEASEGAALVSSMALFPKEQKMYQVHIPNFIKLYKEAGADIQLAPKCLYIEETPERVTLVMEDLRRKNFKNIDRLNGFDMAHVRCVLRKLAELHAASAVNHELNGAYDNMYHESFFKEGNRDFFKGMMKRQQPIYAKSMRQWGLENAETYLKIFQDASKYFDAGLKMNTVDESEFNVLNHGDCWANNIMFNYKENGEIDNTIFVDLQVGKWGSPAQDLWYMITTSVALDIKIKEFDHFIQIYHERLAECLKLLKYKKHIPTLSEIHILMIKYGFWGPMTANGVMVPVLLPSDKDASMDNLLAVGPEADEFRYKAYTNTYYVNAAKQLYPFFANKGCLPLE